MQIFRTTTKSCKYAHNKNEKIVNSRIQKKRFFSNTKAIKRMYKNPVWHAKIFLYYNTRFNSPKKELMKNPIKNYLSTIFFIFLVYFFYNSFEYYHRFFFANFLLKPLEIHINSFLIFKVIISLYIFLLPIFYTFYTGKSKALLVLEFLSKKITHFSYRWSHEEKTALLAWIVKAFWAPLMIFWLSDHIITMINNTVATYQIWDLWKTNFIGFFDTYFFWFAFSIILFSDVFFFTLWYLIEAPILKNTIKSVEPTLLWWAVALASYPPFNWYVTNGISFQWNTIIPWINWYSQDFPKFDDPTLHITMNCLILLLMWMYSYASISLGWKASNLTNRWIITHWPYRFVRHPAYICKNTAWWIGGLPFIINAVRGEDWNALFYIILGLSGWSFIYFMRAWTEERHLSKDEEYRKYKKKVKYRFIPWVL